MFQISAPILCAAKAALDFFNRNIRRVRADEDRRATVSVFQSCAEALAQISRNLRQQRKPALKFVLRQKLAKALRLVWWIETQNAPNAWMKTIKYLVEDLHVDVNAKDVYNYTPLHGAAFRGDNEMVQYLVDHGAAPSLTVKSKRGQAPSDMANGQIVNADLPVFHPETVALLVKMGSPEPSVFGPNHK